MTDFSRLISAVLYHSFLMYQPGRIILCIDSCLIFSTLHTTLSSPFQPLILNLVNKNWEQVFTGEFEGIFTCDNLSQTLEYFKNSSTQFSFVKLMLLEESLALHFRNKQKSLT